MTDRTARRLAICIVAATGLFVAAFAVFRLASRVSPLFDVDYQRQCKPARVCGGKQVHGLAAPVAVEAEEVICSFTDPPLAGGNWALWQHSHRGRVPGVPSAADLNTFNGSYAEFLEFLNH